MSMLNWFLSEDASRFGSFLSGIITLVAFIFAVFQVNAWKEQEKLRKKAEVAGKVLVGSIRIFQAMDFLVSPAVDTPKDPAMETGPTKHTYQMRADFSQRLEMTSPDLNSFFVLRNEAEVYLSEEVNAVLQEIWLEWVSLKVDIQMVINYKDSGNLKSSHYIEVYEHTFGGKGLAKREAHRNKLKSLLIPIARID